MREYQLGLGMPREQVYNQTMYILVGMLVVGLICNLLVKPVNPKYFMTDAELTEEAPRPRARRRRPRSVDSAAGGQRADGADHRRAGLGPAVGILPSRHGASTEPAQRCGKFFQ